jgi:hypothetical protein
MNDQPAPAPRAINGPCCGIFQISDHSGSVLKVQPAPPGMPFGVHIDDVIDVTTSMANLEVFFLSPRYPRPPGAPPW